jgi:EAL and modified HD-GYP domain-containing signal transduction protein
LKYINSALFGLRREVESIRQALALLGENNFKKWISLIALAGMGEDKPVELVISSIIRAKFCEALSDKVGLSDRSQDLFLLGMFSMIDAIIDRPMPDILAELPISDDIKGTLLGETNRLASVYESIIAYEKGNWAKFSETAAQLRLDEGAVPAIYEESVEWANQLSELA